MKIEIVLVGVGLCLGGLQVAREREPMAQVAQAETVEVTPTPTATPTPTPTIAPLTVRGQASYYWTGGCLGCNDGLIMANGEKLDDNKATIALVPETVRKYKLLNKQVTIKNTETGATTTAIVTDTGGFARHGRVADLSRKTRDNLGCGGLCDVEIIFEMR